MTDTTDRPSLGDVLRQWSQRAAAGICVCRPAKIARVVSDSEVDVQPLVSDPDGNDDPGIKGVPLLMPGTSRLYTLYPVRVGDPVLLIFADRDIDHWQSKGGNSKADAESTREHDITDAIAIPLVLRPSSTAVEFFGLMADVIDLLSTCTINDSMGGACVVSWVTSGQMAIALTKLKTAGVD